MSIYMYIHICDKKERKQHKNTEGNSQCQQSTTPQPSCGVSQVCPPPPPPFSIKYACDSGKSE